MTEIVPQVAFEVEWRSPRQATISHARISSDACRTRLSDVANAAVQHALESVDGEAEVTITVRRLAKKPTGVRIVGK